MSLQINLDREAGRPLYQQIAAQIRAQIGAGQLPTGTRLPTIRQLSQSLGVTRLTVQSAYGELQAEGLIEATVGRGTFVASTAQPRSLMATLGRRINPDSVLNDLLQVTQIPVARSLAIADPDPMLFPAEEFWDSLGALRPNAAALLQYQLPQGDALLRVELAKLMQERGVEVVPDEIIVTSGVTQALSLVTQALARPGDTVVVEQPTYLGLLHILKAHGVRPVGVPLDAEGPQLDALERIAIQQRPRFFYTIPSFQNPTGICMSPARRRDVLALAERYGLLLVEDDLYSRLSYDNPAPPALKAGDSTGVVIYLDGVSKMLLPGLRVGYLVAPSPLREQLLSLRRSTDLCGPGLVHRALADFLHKGKLRTYLRRAVPRYRERRDTLLQALQRSMPDGVSWTTPEGGYCCWVTMPPSSALGDLYQAALARGVVFTPGEVFLAEAEPHRHLRLCFGSQPPDVIREAVGVVGELVHERLVQGERPRQQAHEWALLV